MNTNLGLAAGATFLCPYGASENAGVVILFTVLDHTGNGDQRGKAKPFDGVAMKNRIQTHQAEQHPGVFVLGDDPLCVQKPTTVLLFVIHASVAMGAEEAPVTWDEFHRHFQFGLHCTLFTQPTKVTWNPTMHYTGPESPFVQYVREMRTYGFSGILLQLRNPEAYVPEQDAQGTWRIPEDKMKQIHGAVDVATEAGYWLILEVNPIKYEDLRDTRPHIKLKPEERYTDDWVEMDYDIWQQVIREFKSYRHIGYRTNNEFHGYKWEQKLPPDHPKYLTAEQARVKFMKYMIEKGVLARRIKPTAWVFYRNRGQILQDAQNWDFPFGIDPPPTQNPCYYGLSYNFNVGDCDWGFHGLNHPKYTEQYIRWHRLNRFPPPRKEAAALLREFRRTKWKHVGAVVNRFGLDYHKSRVKTCKRFMTDYQNLAQMAFLMDYFNEDKSITTYPDGDTSGGNKQNGIFNTKRNKAHAYNSPCIDQFLHVVLQKSYSRQLKLQTTTGGTISHHLGPLHRGVHMVRIGDRIALEAKPKRGYRFAGWAGSARGTANPLTVTVPDSHGAICATFAKPGEKTPTPEVWLLKRHWEAHDVFDYAFADSAKPAQNFADVENPLYRPVNTRDPDDVGKAKHVFLKFKVDKVPSDRSRIAYATIKFRNYPKGDMKKTPCPRIAVYATDPSWHRRRLTWSNRPRLDAEPLSVADYGIWQEQIHLEVTDYIAKHGTGLHSFCVIATQDRPYGQDVEITACRKHHTVRTHDKPLLYVVWDERLPVVPWERQADGY